MKQYIEMLKNPPSEAKGWTRWWWYGCAVDKKEIAHELSEMAKAGMGGAEIQILYPLMADDAKTGVHNISYFSPEFFEILQYTVDTAKELGMEIDFTLGSAWPYGGPFVPRAMGVQNALPYQIDVTGPVSNYSFDFTTLITGNIAKIIMGKMENSQMIEDSIIDLSDKLVDKQLFGWPWGEMIEGVEIPEGNWKIVAFVINGYAPTISVGSRDANGWVIDHCRKDIAEYFFRHAGKPIVDRLGKGAIKCFFCDSIELAGHNWTSILFDEFKKRRGYDLGPYVYALWGEIAGITDRIRHDYYQTMSELTLENFFQTMTDWCRENGSKSRIQAHGIWADILKAYAIADIPEGETFGPQDMYKVNTIHRRLASSAGHLYGKTVISNETFTWLRVPRFLETLEIAKKAVDAVFLDGMNAIYNHGYSYTQPDAPQPGWAFFASCHMNHNNTYWECYPEFARYIQRMSALLRQGRHHCEVAVYLPQHDMWSENQLCDLHMAMKLQEHFGWDVPDRINKSGYYFDYINDEALNTLGEFADGVTINGNTYKVLILIGATRLPEETAESLEKFVAEGGILIAAEKAPSLSCGYMDHESRDAAMQERMAKLFPAECDVWESFGRGFAAVASDRSDKLIEMLSKKFTPDIVISGGEDCVGGIHRKLENGDFYFISNISENPHKVTANLGACGEKICVYDPMDAALFAADDICTENGRTKLTLSLDAFDSVVVFMGKELPEEVLMSKPAEEEKMVLPGPWKFEVAAKGFACEQQQPQFWQNYEKLRYYSGYGTYSTEFEMPAADGAKVYLTFENLQHTAKISVNGGECIKLWKRPWIVDITGFVKEGKNTLVIDSANLVVNCVLDPDNNFETYPGETTEGWPYFSEAVNPSIRRRLGYDRERAAVAEPTDSGISGEVAVVIVR